MISLAVAAAGWVGVSSPGDYAAFKFPPLPRHDLEGAERRLDVVEFISWLDAANAFEDGVTVLERVRAAQMADS